MNLSFFHPRIVHRMLFVNIYIYIFALSQAYFFPSQHLSLSLSLSPGILTKSGWSRRRRGALIPKRPLIAPRDVTSCSGKRHDGEGLLFDAVRLINFSFAVEHFGLTNGAGSLLIGRPIGALQAELSSLGRLVVPISASFTGGMLPSGAASCTLTVGQFAPIIKCGIFCIV